VLSVDFLDVCVLFTNRYFTSLPNTLLARGVRTPGYPLTGLLLALALQYKVANGNWMIRFVAHDFPPQHSLYITLYASVPGTGLIPVKPVNPGLKYPAGLDSVHGTQ